MTRSTVLDTAAVVAARQEALLGLESAAVFPAPLLPARTGSTNDDLADAQAGNLALVATLEQDSGKGRLGRDWVAPPGSCLTFSVNVVAPASASPDALGWITVLTAVVCAAEVNRIGPDTAVVVKWPNDLILEGRKLAGILARLVPGGNGQPHRVVVGVGLNLSQTAEELPVSTATSLALNGIDVSAEDLLGRIWARLGTAVDQFFAAGGNVHAPLSSLAIADGADGTGADGAPRSLLQAARESSSTLGSDVRVHLPGGNDLVGTAVDLGEDGCLIVEDTQGQRHHVHAGDVVHLRRSDGGYV